MGQGIYTAQAMLVADELDVDMAQVRVEHAPADDRLYANPLFRFQATGGSTSVRAFFTPLRQAGAAARTMLVAAAAEGWGVAVTTCATESGTVLTRPRGVAWAMASWSIGQQTCRCRRKWRSGCGASTGSSARR